MQIIAAADIHRLLDFPALIAALRGMFGAGCEAPPRQHYRIAPPSTDGAPATLLLMPAWRTGDGGGAIGIKIVSVFPDNAKRALPSVHGTYVLLDGETGLPRAVLDGTALTLRRTAAASALAADFLARRDAAVHLMVGTGALAPYLIAAHGSVRPIRDVRVWGRDPVKAAALAARLAAMGTPAVAANDLAAAVHAADIVSCATLATLPLIRGQWLRPGTHVDLVGGFTPDMREADDAAIGRSRVYIDTEMATQEAGDIVQPLRTGALTREQIAGDLFRLCRGECPGRCDPVEITLFKSVGTALEDLAAAELACSRFALPQGG